MRVVTRKAALFGAVAALAVFVAAGPGGLMAADHLDAPGLTPPGGDSRLDINDVYAFQSPADSKNAVVIVTVNPAAGALTGQLGFHPDAKYQILADTNTNAKPDERASFTFGPMNSSGQQSWRLKLKGGGRAIEGVTGVTTDLGGGFKVTAGTFDDPFFFDLNNFLASDFTCGTNETPGDTTPASNFFAGLNTLAIVLEFPSSELSGTAGIWARTLFDGQQIDRMGRPAINTVFIPNNIFEPVGSEPSQRNAFNAGMPQRDQRDFRGEIVDTLDIFYDDPAAIAGLADLLLPDVLTVDFSSTDGFLNGRQLADDVIDAELGIVTNGAVTTDCVGNDSAFVGVHPYLAPKN